MLLIFGVYAGSLQSEHCECSSNGICCDVSTHSSWWHACIEAIGEATISKLAQIVIVNPLNLFHVLMVVGFWFAFIRWSLF